jgi:hypothetical protein
MVIIKIAVVIGIYLLHLTVAFAQESLPSNGGNTEDIEVIEAEVKKTKTVPKENSVDKDFFDEKKIDFAGLARLTSFKDVAILQKRYLPKTNRFQFNLGFNTITNNAWFITSGYDARLSFFFNERGMFICNEVIEIRFSIVFYNAIFIVWAKI